MRSALRLLVSGAIFSLLCAGSVFAQASQTGGITGVITDQGGALVSGATIEVINEATGKTARTATTADDGGYSVSLLTPGVYRLHPANRWTRRRCGRCLWPLRISCSFCHFPPARPESPLTFVPPDEALPTSTLTDSERAITASRWKESTLTILILPTSTLFHFRIRARWKR